MLKKMILMLLSVFILLMLFITLSISKDMKKGAKEKEDRALAREKKVEQFLTEEKKHQKEKLLLLDLTDETTHEDLDKILHSMTHQKVVADDKWTHIPLVEETVAQLVEFIENPSFEIAEDDDSMVTYEWIIHDWARGDFSEIVEHHNRVWLDLGGTIGEAYGTMTKGEERDYITQHFGYDFMDYLVETGQWQD